MRNWHSFSESLTSQRTKALFQAARELFPYSCWKHPADFRIQFCMEKIDNLLLARGIIFWKKSMKISRSLSSSLCHRSQRLVDLNMHILRKEKILSSSPPGVQLTNYHEIFWYIFDDRGSWKSLLLDWFVENTFFLFLKVVLSVL